jgi:hypothetical protein
MNEVKSLQSKSNRPSPPMLHSRFLWLAAGLFLSQSSLAATLGELLKLPNYLSKNYGDVEIENRTGVLGGSFEKTGSVNHSKSGPSAQKTIFRLSRPSNADAKKYSYDLALSLFDALSRYDARFIDAVEDLGSTYIQSAKGEFDTRLLHRIRKVFADRMVGQKDDRSDGVAQMWFHLKFEASDTKTNARKLKKGDPILLLQRQYGYFMWHKNPLVRLRRHLDLGHSNIGIRYVGMGPENDLVINPGSKTRTNYETTLPTSPNPDVPNMVHVGNLWDWTETQISLRYMDVEFFAIQLTDNQIKALKHLIPTLNGLNFGPALAMSNNCADGAMALVNFLMPIERTFDAKSLFGAGPSLPSFAVKGAAKRFANTQYYKYESVDNPNESAETPGTAYNDQKFTRKQLKTFDEYLQFERSKIAYE